MQVAARLLLKRGALVNMQVVLLRQDVELLRQDVVNILIEHAGNAQGDPLARRRQERTLPGKSLDDNALKMSMQGEALFLCTKNKAE